MSTSFSDLRGSRRGSTSSVASSEDSQKGGPTTGQRRGSLDRLVLMGRSRAVADSSLTAFANGKLATIPDDSADAAAAAAKTEDAADEHQGRTSLFQACVLKKFSLIDGVSKAQEHTDKDGNTLLHALFLTSDVAGTSSDFDVDEFAKAVNKLVKAGIDPSAENADRRNCLLGSELDQNTLKRVLLRLACSDLKPAFSKLQRNSEGLHAVHVFASRYNIGDLQSALSQLCDLSHDQLLCQLMTSADGIGGATCLHFACQAGHEESIKFLLNQGLDLAAETEDGSSCVDLACNSGELEALTSVAAAAGIDLRDILVLTDPAKRALQLPDESSARSQLALYKRAVTGRSANVRRLWRALELDSSDILCGLIASNFVTSDTNPQLTRELQSLLKEEPDEGKSYETLMQNETVRPILLDHPEVSLLDFAIFFGKTNLVSELSVLPQFDIIPKNLYLLIQLRTKIKLRQGNRERLLGARTEALNVLINVLEQLYSNGSEYERQLLFHYMTGTFFDSQGVRGPMFLNPQCFNTGAQHWGEATTRLEYASAMELVDVADSVELFGTECLSKLVAHYWRLPPPLPWRCEVTEEDVARHGSSPGTPQSRCRSSGCSVKVRFGLHSFYYTMFLAFFAWYVTDFGRALRHPAPDVLLWLCAVTQTLQWFNQFAAMSEWREVSYTLGRSVCRFFTLGLTYVDLIALGLLYTGLGLKLVAQSRDNGVELLVAAQGVMGASFLFGAFRMITLYSYFRVTGAKISMFLGLLYKDFWPFFNFAFIIVVAFGVFFLALMFPVVSSTVARDAWPVFKHVFVIPLHLMFGDFAKVEMDACNDTALASGFECAAETGYLAISKYLVFLFLIVVNIVLVNLLIALFSLRVAVMDAKSVAIWRRNRYAMLLEYSNASPVPMPLSFLHYTWLLCSQVYRRTRGGRRDARKQLPWWQRDTFANYPPGYRAFLTYQAKRLRTCRAKLRLGVERNRDGLQALGAYVESQLDRVRDDVAREATDRQRQLQEQLQHQSQQMSQVLDLLLLHRSQRTVAGH